MNRLENDSPTKRPVVLKMSMSIDGFVCGPRGEIDWIFSTRDEGSTSWVVDTLSSAGVHIMGNKTYRDMAAFWPTSTLPFATAMNEIPKVVFSRGCEAEPPAEVTDAAEPHSHASWRHPGRAGSDLVRDIAALKGKPGGYILAHGGAAFARSLVAADVVDEYRLFVHPVALGQGRSIFSGLAAPLNLELAEARSFRAGVVAKRYVRVRQSA